MGDHSVSVSWSWALASAWMRPSMAEENSSIVREDFLDCATSDRISPSTLRTRWFNSAISSSCWSCARLRSIFISSESFRTTSRSVTRIASAARSDVGDQLALRLATSSFQTSKLLRGVSRAPKLPTSTGLCGLPAQVTCRATSVRNSTM